MTGRLLLVEDMQNELGANVDVNFEGAVRASERRLAYAICDFKNGPGYELFRSEEFPGFYAGNGIIVDGTRPELSIEDWEAIFREHFPNPPFPHVTLVFPEDSSSTTLIERAAAIGFRVFSELLMVAPVAALLDLKTSNKPASKPELLDLTRDREALFDLHLSEARTADWFEGAKSFRGLFQKTMALSDRIGMQWVAIREAGHDSTLASALAYFDHGPICRLQEVITAPTARRQGHASRLIQEVASRAASRDIQAIGLVAEAGEEGHRLYCSLGFTDLACDVTLMRY